MATILLSLADLGAAMPLQETLERGGHSVSWDGESAAGPTDTTAKVDLVILDAESDGCEAAAEGWRDFDPPPGVLMVGQTAEAQTRATESRCSFVSHNAADEVFAEQVADALRLRFAGRMSMSFARAVLGIGPASDVVGDAARIIEGSRSVALDLVRECLRWHGYQYVCANSLIKDLREARALSIPEVEVVKELDGTRTVQKLVAPQVGDSIMRGRLLWGLLSSGAASCSHGPPDEDTLERRLIGATRRHLLARRNRLAKATHYDVLEVHTSANAQRVDYAARTLALRYAPDRLQRIDLGEYAVLVGPNWQQVLAARQLLMNGPQRQHYDTALAASRGQFESAWAFEVRDKAVAEESYRKGQAALVAGEAFKAVSSMAAACRNHPEHPDYEVSLCWAKFRADIERGGDREVLIGKAREEAEGYLVGRRPWPRALVALALLCAADSDADAARFHLREALSVDPNLPAAKQLLGRL